MARLAGLKPNEEPMNTHHRDLLNLLTDDTRAISPTDGEDTCPECTHE